MYRGDRKGERLFKRNGNFWVQSLCILSTSSFSKRFSWNFYIYLCRHHLRDPISPPFHLWLRPVRRETMLQHCSNLRHLPRPHVALTRSVPQKIPPRLMLMSWNTVQLSELDWCLLHRNVSDDSSYRIACIVRIIGCTRAISQNPHMRFISWRVGECGESLSISMVGWELVWARLVCLPTFCTIAMSWHTSHGKFL